MKRRNLFLVVTLTLSFFVVNAQNAENGDMILNFGLGFGVNYTAGGNGFSNSIPPLSTSFEFIVKDELLSNGKGAIGIGANAQYMNYKYSVNNIPGTEAAFLNGFVLKSLIVSSSTSDWKYNKIIFGPRGYFHYNFLEKLDTYTGLMFGLDHVSWGAGNTHHKHTGFIWSWFLGGRYYFNDNLAAMLELGYGATYGNIGIAYKFGK